MKKKILILSTFLFAVLAIMTFNRNEVKAEENCTTYYNYYLFLDYNGTDFINSRLNTPYVTSKEFDLSVTSGAKNVGQGKLDLVADGGSTNATTWTIRNFYDNYKSVESSHADDAEKWYTCDETKCYATAIRWEQEDGTITTNHTAISASYSEFLNGVPKGLGSPTFSNPVYDENGFNAGISRKWFLASQSNKIVNINDEEITGHVWSPAVYYIKYDICEDTPEEDTPQEGKNNKVTIHYYIDSTTTKLHDDYFEKNIKVGTYTKECPETLEKDGIYYDRINKNVTVEMAEDSKEELICNYKEQTYTLTINYGSDDNCTNLLADSKTIDNIKAGSLQVVEAPNSLKSNTFTGLGVYSSQITNKPVVDGNKVTFTMPAKNSSICLVYTPQTGSNFVRMAIVIAIFTLGVATWYYSKNRRTIKSNV